MKLARFCLRGRSLKLWSPALTWRWTAPAPAPDGFGRFGRVLVKPFRGKPRGVQTKRAIPDVSHMGTPISFSYKYIQTKE